MSNRMSEDMSDRMPEDLPVRKCINVMVGITRSKVIFFQAQSLSSILVEDTFWRVLFQLMPNRQLLLDKIMMTSQECL